MSDQYGPQQPHGGLPSGGWQPQNAPQNWPPQGGQPAGPQGWQPQGGQPAGPQGWQPQGGYPGSPQGWQPQGGPPAGYGGAPQWHPTDQRWQPDHQQPAWQPDHQPGFSPSAPPPPKKRSSAVVITVCSVIVALLAATGVWYFAFRDTKPNGGQASPQEAASAMLVSLSQKDPVGVADQLDPAEAAMFSDLTGDVLTELKRLNVVTADASPSNMSGATVTVDGLTYDPNPEAVNDHLTIVKLTGGTVTLTSDPSKIPLTEKIRSAFGTRLTSMRPQTKTINIADEVAKQGHPIRIATVQRNGKWYPSVFYTVADTWAQSAKLGTPKAEDAIPSKGTATPEETMTALLAALSAGDATQAISLLAPDEMGVLHDYGSMLLKAAKYDGPKSSGVTFSNASWNVTETTGGQLVSIKSMTVSIKGKDYALQRDGDTLTVTVPGEAPLVLNDSTIDGFITKMGGKLDPQGIAIIKQEFKQVIGIGVVMTKAGDGNWYVSPLRSYVGIFTALLKGLQPGDIDYLVSLARK